MRIILKELSRSELSFLLRLLNAAGATIELLEPNRHLRREAVVSAEDAIWLDSVGDRLRRSYEKGKVHDEIRRPNSWFAMPAEKRSVKNNYMRNRNLIPMQNAWSFARGPLLDAIVRLRKNPGNFVHWPSIVGLPAHHPAVLINDPFDLVGWMIARGMANRQLQRFVKCAREECGKFGLRTRAKKDARFCSVECQRKANDESRKLRSAGIFGQTSPPTLTR
jgi:hypothetical protein